jgi:SNF2 family DNA or RNA helicase
VEDQATDRCHRLGQTRPLSVARFVAAGSVEEKMLELQDLKRKLVEVRGSV